MFMAAWYTIFWADMHVGHILPAKDTFESLVIGSSSPFVAATCDCPFCFVTAPEDRPDSDQCDDSRY